MPLTYFIDSAQRTVFSTLSGEVSFMESKSFHQRLLSDPLFDPTYAEFADLSAMTGTSITSDEMRRLGEIALFSKHAKRAFLTPNPLIYGLTRMYEAHCAVREETGIKLFSSRDEALAWLGVTTPKTAE